MKILLVGTDLFRADGRTDMMKLTVTFRNFANAPEHHEVERRMWKQHYRISELIKIHDLHVCTVHQ